MRYGLILASLVLVSCVVHDHPRYRTVPQPPPPPPSPTESQPPRKEPEPRTQYPVPADYSAALKQIESIKVRIAELIDKDRLFEVPGLAKHMSFVAGSTPELVERDAVKGVIDRIEKSSQALLEVADLLERRAAQESKENVLAVNSEILPTLEVLKRFEILADDYEVQNVPRGCPATYKRALSRINGIYNSIHEHVQADRLFEVPAVARHLRQVSENLRRLAVNNISHPMKAHVKEASDKLRESCDLLSFAAEREDKAKAQKEFDALADPMQLLAKLEALYSGATK